MISESKKDPGLPGFFGGPSLKTRTSKSVVTNGHTPVRDPKAVRIGFGTNPVLDANSAPFPKELSGEVEITWGEKQQIAACLKLSKNARNKYIRYGKLSRTNKAKLQYLCRLHGVEIAV